MSRIFPLMFVCLLSALTLFATPQIPDMLIYEGREYPIYNGVMGPYFSKYPERNPKREDYVCSAAWDGYTATFEIKDRKLFLKDITDEPCEFGDGKSALKKVVPNGESLFIDWQTGVLLSMSGDNQEDPYSLQFLDAFSRYSLFEIDAGVLKRVKHLSNKEYKKYRELHFKAYSKTDEYKKDLKRLTANGRMTTSEADSDIKFWIFWKAKKLLAD